MTLPHFAGLSLSLPACLDAAAAMVSHAWSRCCDFSTSAALQLRVQRTVRTHRRQLGVRVLHDGSQICSNQQGHRRRKRVLQAVQQVLRHVACKIVVQSHSCTGALEQPPFGCCVLGVVPSFTSWPHSRFTYASCLVAARSSKPSRSLTRTLPRTSPARPRRSCSS